MSEHRRSLVAAAVEDAGLPAFCADEVVNECPWLDGEVEVSDELGPELFAEQASRLRLSPDQVRGFLFAYNRRVRSYDSPEELLRSQAYASVTAALAGHGRESAFGGGDYWLVSDSFSTSTPTVVVSNGFRLSASALEALQRVISSYGNVFNALRISSEEGEELEVLKAT
jgi:hypothetical protein